MEDFIKTGDGIYYSVEVLLSQRVRRLLSSLQHRFLWLNKLILTDSQTTDGGLLLPNTLSSTVTVSVNATMLETLRCHL